MGKIKKLLNASQRDLVDDDESYFAPALKQTKNKKKHEEEKEQEWLDDNLEGQLSVDVFQKGNNIIIKSTIAGVKPEDIDIAVQNDMVTIRGKREDEQTVTQENYFYQECYWGNFSRSIILPVEVKAESTKAELNNGILTITLPKAKRTKSISVKVKNE